MTALLLRLAQEFESQGAYAQAIKCLTPLCGEGSGELPAVVAHARLRVACLLLAHFDNVQEAKAVLLTAEHELRQTQGHHLLKCELWDALSRCNQQLGAVAAEQGALVAGLKACRHGATSKDKEALARWRVYFHFRLAEHGLTHSGPEAAGAALSQLSADATLHLTPTERALHLLCCATLALVQGDTAAASPHLEQAVAAIEEAGAGDAVLHCHLRCHYVVLFVSMAVMTGRINDLSTDASGSIALLAQVQQLLTEAGGAPWSYPWLHPAAVGAVANLLHASLLRSLGKAAPSAACLLAAAEAVDQQLAVLGIDLQGVETQLGVAAIWEGRVFCHLRALVAEQQAVEALLACRFGEAGEGLVWLTGLLERFPSLLRDMAPGVQLLLGHYAHSVQEYAAASVHFQAVLHSDAPMLQDSAAVAAALAELRQEPGAPGGLRRAVEVLNRRGLRAMPHILSLPVHDRTTALVVNALVAERMGDASNATLMLTKALKTAHAHLGNTQMVAQVLNVLAPLQASKGDHDGAKQMLNSALTLGSVQRDLPTVVTASRGLLRVLAAAGGAEQQQQHGKRRASMQSKQAELEGAVRAAVAAPAHAVLLAWRPPGQQ